jgi:hypothetical protein
MPPHESRPIEVQRVLKGILTLVSNAQASVRRAAVATRVGTTTFAFLKFGSILHIIDNQ